MSVTYNNPAMTATLPKKASNASTFADRAVLPDPAEPTDPTTSSIVALGRSDDQQAVRAAELATFDDERGQITIGRGYNIFGKYGSPLSLASAVLDYDRLAHDQMVDIIAVNAVDTRVHEGASMAALSRSIETTTGSTVGFGAFAGSVESSFGSVTARRKEFAYASLMKLFLQRRVVVTNLDADDLKAYMVDSARAHINDPDVDPKAIIEMYGTHVVVDALYGGRFEHHLATNRLAFGATTSMSTAVESSFDFARGEGGATAGFSSLEEREAYLRNSKARTIAEGGDAQIVRGPQDLDAWSESLNADNAVLVGFSDLGLPLIPLWYFADDSDRQYAIEQAVLDDAVIAQKLLLDMPMTLEVKLKFQIQNDRDEGPKLELYGTQTVHQILDGYVIESRNLFSRGPGQSFSVGKGRPVNAPRPVSRQTLKYSAEQNISDAQIMMTGRMIERDPGRSGDDYLGIRDLELRFGQDRILGVHKLRYDERGNKVDAIYEISLAD